MDSIGPLISLDGPKHSCIHPRGSKSAANARVSCARCLFLHAPAIAQTWPDMAIVDEDRKLYRALRRSNSKFPNAWIASIRLEEAAGKLKAARSLSQAACKQCPESADLWLE